MLKFHSPTKCHYRKASSVSDCSVRSSIFILGIQAEVAPAVPEAAPAAAAPEAAPAAGAAAGAKAPEAAGAEAAEAAAAASVQLI